MVTTSHSHMDGSHVIVALLILLTGHVCQVPAQVPVEKIAFDRCEDGFCGVSMQNADRSGELIYFGTGMKPSWSTDGSKMAFASYGNLGTEVSVRNLVDGTVTNLTNHPGNDGAPSWSPDGSRIAFQSDRNGVLELYSMRSDGSDVTQLTHNMGFTGDPAWSPDGTTIAYDCEIQPGNRDICTIDVATGLIVQLTTDPAWDSGPTWSPDSSKIAFATTRYGSQYWVSVIAILNLDGTGVRAIAATSGGSQPAWSPDGSRIAFRYPDCYYDGEWFCYDGIAIANLTNNHADVFSLGSNPSWGLSTVTLKRPVASIQYGCTGLTCTFDGSGSFDPDGTITNYEWTFGDGTTASGALVSHTFPDSNKYFVTLSVTDNIGVINYYTVSAPNVAPIAAFTSSCTGLFCRFDASVSSDSDGTITNYDWTFGDGGVSSGLIVGHNYSVAGSFLVTLTVTDDSYARVTQTGTVTIAPNIVHVGDLDGAAMPKGSVWTAFVTITAHAWDHSPVANVTVTGSWTSKAPVSCTTNALGQCVVSTSISRGTKNLGFTVATVESATRPYDATMNHDPDDDSNGTSIIVSRP